MTRTLFVALAIALCPTVISGETPAPLRVLSMCPAAPSGTRCQATGTLVDFDITGRLHEIDVPVLFIAGQHDEALPETLAELRQLVPDSRPVVMLDAAHATRSKKAHEYLTVVEPFLDSVEAQK